MGLAAGNVSRVVNSLDIMFPEFMMTELTKMEFLGPPFLKDATRVCIMKKISEYERIDGRILLLYAHPLLFKLKSYFFHPPFLLTFRSAPCHHHRGLQAEYNDATLATTEALCNIHFDIKGCRPNCPFGMAAFLESVQSHIWHSLRFSPHARRLITSCVSQ